jgi:hypothetical protein
MKAAGESERIVGNLMFHFGVHFSALHAGGLAETPETPSGLTAVYAMTS